MSEQEIAELLAVYNRLLDFVQWLALLDEPGNEERRTVTLTKIIDRAHEAIAPSTSV